MKKWKAVTAVVCMLCAAVTAGFLYASVGQTRDAKAGIIEYVQTNQEALEQFAVGLMENPSGDNEYNGWQVTCYGDARMVEFVIRGTGVGSSTTYEGFYYSEDDCPIGFQGTEAGFVPDDTGWSWEEENGNNRERTERITARWYWFQMNF